MKFYRLIYSCVVAALFMCGCQAYDDFVIEPTPSVEGVTLRADFRVGDFGSNAIETRTGAVVYDIATARELDIDNAYVFVFSVEESNPDVAVSLLEVSPIIPDANSVDQETSFFVLTKREQNVKLYFFANIPKTAIDEFIEGGQFDPVAGLIGSPTVPYLFSDFVNVTIPYTLENNVLKTTTTGSGLESDLPMYIEPFLMSSVSQESLDAIPQPIPAVFAYARIDMLLEDGDSSTSLKEISVAKVPVLPPSPTGSSEQQFLEQSHRVGPETNEAPYPSGVTEENLDTKYIGGLYMYPTNPLRYYTSSSGYSSDSGVKTSVIAKINRSGDGEDSGDRYYNILINYTPEGETETKYGLDNGTRYLIRINRLGSPGYLTEDEARLAPPSNIDYDIVIDSNVSDFSANGQYYLGIERDSYKAVILSEQSNMLYVSPDRNDYFLERDDPSWYIVSDDYVEVDVEFTDGLGVGLSVADVDVEKRIELPDGVTISEGGDWTESFGRHTVRLRLNRSFSGGDIKIVVGELSKSIHIDFKDIITTDYTDISFVNLLTGLSGDGRGNADGLRVANSYILVPDDNFGAEYYIPVNDRIDEFWGADYGNNALHVGLSDVDWRDDDSYTVEMLWSDGDPSGITIEKSYSPPTNVTSAQNAIKAYLPSGAQGQNILVAVKQSGTVIWSWHLWVTDYNPYISTSGTPRPVITTEGAAASVVGGSIYRYSGSTLWADGSPFEQSAVMDRNIGASSTARQSQINQGSVLFYQFGRKDPFPWSSTLWDRSGSSAVSFATSVYNPTIYYYTSSGNWANQDTNIEYLWNDKNAPVTGNNKSIFDPSPLGWMVPKGDVWQNFVAATLTWSSSGDNHGLTYNSGSYSTYYPVSSHIRYYAGTLNNSAEVLAWSSEPSTTTISNAMVATGVVSGSASVVNGTLYRRASGYPLRSVREL